MPTEIPSFDDEPNTEIQSIDIIMLAANYVVQLYVHSPDGIVTGGRVGPASSMLFSLTTPTLTVYSTLGSRSLTVILV